jgi:hypothetical protein
VTLPEALYERAKETAEASARSLEEVVAQSLALSLPGLERDLPSDIRLELAALPLLSDTELEDIAQSTMDEEQQARLEALAALRKQRPLTPAEESTLAHLMDEAQRVMLRKAEAYRMLARRGHAVFSPPDASPD